MFDPKTFGLTEIEMLEALGTNKRALRAVTKKHNIPVLKVGRSRRYDEVAVAALKEALRQGHPSEPVASYHGRRHSSDFERAMRLTTVAKRKRDLAAIREASAALQRAEAVLESTT